jgi:hypothetical protein
MQGHSDVAIMQKLDKEGTLTPSPPACIAEDLLLA